MTTALSSLAQSAGNKAAAEAAFEQGKQLMQAGDFRQACLKFEASQKLDEGIGTLLYLGDCYEKLGRTASAWATFKEAASVAGAQGQDSRQKLATQRARALEPKLVKLTIDVSPGNESIAGFEVRSDGVTIPSAQFATPFPIDPGTHRIEASAPGKKAYTETVDATRGSAHVSVPVLADLPASSTPAASPPEGAARAGNPQPASPLSMNNAPAADARHDGMSDSGRTQRTLSYIAGGLGLVGVGVGTYFGIAAISDNSASKDGCPEPNTCRTKESYDQRQDALRQARVSTIAFTAGGALLATAAVLYFTASPNRNRFTARAQISDQAALLDFTTHW